MEIRFLYSDQCPSHDEAIGRLRKVLEEEGIDAKIEVVRVETFEDAKRYRYPGSPTILIDGRDIDPIRTMNMLRPAAPTALKMAVSPLCHRSQ